MRYSRFPVVFLALHTLCLGQASPNVQVSLSLANGKTSYQIGEPVLLRLTFTAAARASLNVTTTDPASPIDRLVLSPPEGAFPWLADQAAGHPYTPDYAMIEPVDSGMPKTVDLTLNDVYRFDAPGRYSVYVVTNRTQSSLTSNPVSFDIQPMSDGEEANRAAQLEQQIRQAGTLQAARQFVQELDWLTGDASTRAKLSLFLHPKHFYPFQVDVTKGLWIARNRALVVDHLVRALSDPSQELPPDSPLLRTAVDLSARLSSQPADDIESSYLKQLAASLPQRKGASLATAAETLLVRLAARNQVSGPVFSAAREAVIAHFAEVNEYNVDWLLNGYGRYLIDPRLVPALSQILATQTSRILAGERTAVIRQLLKIAPLQSQSLVASEVCGDNATFTQILNEVPFPVLPETDDCLIRKIRAAAYEINPRPLESASLLAARFASSALSGELFSLYQEKSGNWPPHSKGYLLAYLVRWNPQRALPLLDAALPRGSHAPDVNIAYALGQAGDIPALNSFWCDRLATSPPEFASQAASQLSQHGPAGNQAVLQARLQSWRTHWQGLEIPEAEGRFEVELTQAIMRGAAWQLSPGDAHSLAAGCLSQACRTNFAATLAH